MELIIYTFQFAIGMDKAMKSIHQEAFWNREKDRLIRCGDLKTHKIFSDNIDLITFSWIKLFLKYH